jgi:hypothetical protein
VQQGPDDAGQVQDGVPRGPVCAAEVEKAVHQPRRAPGEHRHAGLAQPRGVGLTLVAQRVEGGGDDRGRGQPAQVGREQR